MVDAQSLRGARERAKTTRKTLLSSQLHIVPASSLLQNENACSSSISAAGPSAEQSTPEIPILFPTRKRKNLGDYQRDTQGAEKFPSRPDEAILSARARQERILVPTLGFNTVLPSTKKLNSRLILQDRSTVNRKRKHSTTKPRDIMQKNLVIASINQMNGPLTQNTGSPIHLRNIEPIQQNKAKDGNNDRACQDDMGRRRKKSTKPQEAPLLNLPSNLVLKIAAQLELKDLSCFSRVIRPLSKLLTPLLRDYAVLEKDGLPPLIWAVRNGYNALILILLDLGFDTNEAWIDTSSLHLLRTPLAEAVRYGHVKTVDLLLKNFADPGFRDLQGCTALHHSMISPNHWLNKDKDSNKPEIPLRTETSIKTTEEIVELLIDESGNINAQDFHGRTVLHYAIGGSEPALGVEVLLNNGANVDIGDEEGSTPIHYSVNLGSGMEDTLELFLAKTVKIDAKNRDQETALHIALYSGLETAVRALLENGADPNIKDQHGQSALELVPHDREDCKAMYELLLDAGANVEDRKFGWKSILDRAVSQDQIELVRVLLENGANPANQDNFGQDVLDRALKECMQRSQKPQRHPNREQIVNLILEGYKTLDVNALDLNGNSLLHRASKLMFPSTVQWLLNNGAGVNDRNDDGGTILHEFINHLQYIANGRHFRERGAMEEVVNLLLDHGVDVNAEDSKGHTPLFKARQNIPNWCGYPAKLLLMKGGKIRRISESGGYVTTATSSREVIYDCYECNIQSDNSER